MKKHVLLLCFWSVFAVLTITANSLVLLALLNTSQPKLLTLKPRSVEVLTSAPQTFSPPRNDILGIQSTIEGDDARVPIVTNFLERHSSPLTPYSDWGVKLVAIADKYNIDFRLLPAIAMQESNLCKKIPEGTYNCLGFGIHERGTLGFANFEESFDRAAKELKKYYIDQGRTSAEEIMLKYTPSSNGSWAESVNQWIAEMKYDDRQKGLILKTNADITEFLAPTPSPLPKSATP